MGICIVGVPNPRGAKTQNFPDSNFLRAKTFRTKCVKSFLTTSLKSAFASHDIAKEVVMNVLPENPDNFEIIRKIGSQLENPESFEIIRIIGSHLEISGQF